MPQMERLRAETPAAAAQPVSLSDAASAEAASQAFDRKIIRNGELTIETDAPADGLRAITAIAESHGGFVVTSEFKRTDNPQSKPGQTVVVVARVPSSQFSAALEQIRGVGGRILLEKVSGEW